MSHVRLTAGRPFCAGTHGPEHLECVKDRALQDKSQGESGSLKDIGGETNLQMADEDCVVHEYIPSAKVRTISEFEEEPILDFLITFITIIMEALCILAQSI